MSNVWRDNALHVMARKCATCIYRPGNLMRLSEGRRDQLERQAVAMQGVITCHETYDTDNAVCRGYFDTQKRHVGLLSAAERMDLLVTQEPA